MKPRRKPIHLPHPIMEAFRALVKSKGFTHEEVRDLLRDGVMSDDPPSLGSVRKWCLNISEPRLHRLDPIGTFVRTFAHKGRPL